MGRWRKCWKQEPTEEEDSTATPGEWLCYQLDTCSPFPLSFLPPIPPSRSFSLLPSPSTLSPGSCPTILLLTPGRQRAEARTKAQLAGYWCSTSLAWPHPIPQGTGCGHARLVQYLENANHGVGCVCVFCHVLTVESEKHLRKMQVIN